MNATWKAKVMRTLVLAGGGLVVVAVCGVGGRGSLDRLVLRSGGRTAEQPIGVTIGGGSISGGAAEGEFARQRLSGGAVAESCTLRVSVLDQEDRGVADVNVRAWRVAAFDDLMHGRSATADRWIFGDYRTGEDGVASFEAPSGDYVVQASSTGCRRSEFRVMQGRPRSSPTTTLTLSSDLRRHGIVVDAFGEPVAQAIVRVQASGDISKIVGMGEVVLSTDGEGRFAFCACDAVDYRIQAHTAEDLSDSSDLVLIEAADSGGDDRPCVVELGGRFRVTGVVRDWLGRPVGGAAVGVAHGNREDVFPTERAVRANAAGEYCAKLTRAGAVTLRASAAGHPVGAFFHAELGAGVVDAALDLYLPQPARFEGRVVDESGSGVGGVRVVVAGTWKWEGKVGEALSDESGRFSIGGAAMDRRYTVSAQPVAGSERGQVALAEQLPNRGPVELVLGDVRAAWVRCTVPPGIEMPLLWGWYDCADGSSEEIVDARPVGDGAFEVAVPASGDAYRLIARDARGKVLESTIWRGETRQPTVLRELSAELTVVLEGRESGRPHGALAIPRPDGERSALVPQASVVLGTAESPSATWRLAPGLVMLDVVALDGEVLLENHPIVVSGSSTVARIALPR